MRYEVLDKGYVKLVQAWGSDEGIVEAARMSTGKGFNGWGPKTCPKCGGNGESLIPDIQGQVTIECQGCGGIGKVPGDEKLLKFLWDNKHHTPFEMAGFCIEVYAPIMVYREWHRHRAQNYNEMSGRYITLPNEFYVPSTERLMGAKQATTNKQSSQGGISENEAKFLQGLIRESQNTARMQYETLLGRGVAREVARIVLPVSQYSRMRAQCNLRMWLHFLNLRMDEAAQWEIRQYANVVGDIVAQTFPRTWELFEASRS